MTPTAAEPTAADGRPPEAATDALRVYVYDPTDPVRSGEVRTLRPDSGEDVFRAVRAGQVVAVVSLDADLSVGPAAEFLNEPTAVVRDLIAGGRLPATAPPFPRIRFADLLAYRDARAAARREALDELRRIDQELGLGD
jgi:hypothetical protein